MKKRDRKTKRPSANIGEREMEHAWRTYYATRTIEQKAEDEAIARASGRAARSIPYDET